LKEHIENAPPFADSPRETSRTFGALTLKERFVLGAWFFFIAGTFILYGTRLREDLWGYALVGNAVLSKADIYLSTPPLLNAWPPFFSLVCVPLGLLSRISPYVLNFFWVALNWASLFVILDLFARLMYRKRFRVFPDPSSLSLNSQELVVPFFLAFPYIIANFEHLQVNTILFALCLVGLYLQSSGKETWGGLALGAAAAMKVMPAVFVPYLFFRRRWRAAASAVVSAAALSISPLLVFGWSKFLSDCIFWLRFVHAGWDVGSKNQSLYAMWARILSYGLVPFFHKGEESLPYITALGVRFAWEATLIVILVLAAVAFRGEPEADSLQAQAEWGVVFILAILAGLITWVHYFVVLMLPYALLYRVMQTAEFAAHRAKLKWVLFASFLLSVPSLHGVVGSRLAIRLETGSVMTFGALVMLGGLLWFRGLVPAERRSGPASAANRL
jgi:hypothetical protein